MKVYRVRLTALDGKDITERTGKASCIANTASIPKDGDYQFFYYHKEPCESPGVAIQVANLEKIGSKFRFYSSENRLYEMEVIKDIDID
jgi:hypothetical protein